MASRTFKSFRRQFLAFLVLLLDMSELRSVIRTTLSYPGTVFVSPMPCFDSDWEYFREAMRQEGLKFARRFDPEDKTLDHVVKYSFTGGLHSRHEKHVPQRLKSLVSSGVFGLWIKWKRLRLEFGCSNRGGETSTPADYMALSMEKSDLYLVFNLLGLLLVASMIAFTCECAGRLQLLKVLRSASSSVVELLRFCRQLFSRVSAALLQDSHGRSRAWGHRSPDFLHSRFSAAVKYLKFKNLGTLDQSSSRFFKSQIFLPKFWHKLQVGGLFWKYSLFSFFCCSKKI